MCLGCKNQLSISLINNPNNTSLYWLIPRLIDANGENSLAFFFFNLHIWLWLNSCYFGTDCPLLSVTTALTLFQTRILSWKKLTCTVQYFGLKATLMSTSAIGQCSEPNMELFSFWDTQCGSLVPKINCDCIWFLHFLSSGSLPVSPRCFSSVFIRGWNWPI